MLSSEIPTRVPLAFAASGAKNVIPTASQIGITDGAASLTDGFPPLTFTPIATGGVPPAGEDFNGVLNLISMNTLYCNAGGIIPYDSTFSTAIGGYPKGAVLSRADATGFWISLTDNNTLNPDTDTTGVWFPANNTGHTAITLTNAHVTLTPLQYAKDTIYLTGTLTGSVNIIFPEISGKKWTVNNNTTGAFTVTCKCSGAGFTILPGESHQVYSVGTATLLPIFSTGRWTIGSDYGVHSLGGGYLLQWVSFVNPTANTFVEVTLPETFTTAIYTQVAMATGLNQYAIATKNGASLSTMMASTNQSGGGGFIWVIGK